MLRPTHPVDVVFLLDVDNTLLDNDRFKDDLGARLRRDFGAVGELADFDLHAFGLERFDSQPSVATGSHTTPTHQEPP